MLKFNIIELVFLCSWRAGGNLTMWIGKKAFETCQTIHSVADCEQHFYIPQKEVKNIMLVACEGGW